MPPRIFLYLICALWMAILISCRENSQLIANDVTPIPGLKSSEHIDSEIVGGEGANNNSIDDNLTNIAARTLMTGSLSISEPWGLALDNQFVYWIDQAEPTAIRRVALTNLQASETVATGSFPTGIVSNPTISANNRWLLFWDRETSYIGGHWKLQALDIYTRQQKIVLEESGAPFEVQSIESLAKIWYAVDENKLAIAYALLSDADDCQRVVLRVVDLESLRSQIVKETNCAKNETIWVWPALYGTDLLLEKDYNATTGGGIDILLYNLQTAQAQMLTQDRLSSAPQISAEFIIWKRAYRSDFGKSLGVYNRQTKQSTVIDFPTPFPRPLLSDHWVYWIPDTYQSLYVYNLQQNTFIQVADAGCTQYISDVAMRNTILAWIRKDMQSNQLFLEWKNVDNLPASEFVHCDPPPV